MFVSSELYAVRVKPIFYQRLLINRWFEYYDCSIVKVIKCSRCCALIDDSVDVALINCDTFYFSIFLNVT